jgi:hypothetical protein
MYPNESVHKVKNSAGAYSLVILVLFGHLPPIGSGYQRKRKTTQESLSTTRHNRRVLGVQF